MLICAESKDGSVWELRKKIDSMLFERTAISKKTEKLIRQELNSLAKEDKLTPSLVMKDPYLFDFLDLKDAYSERNVEQAILRELDFLSLSWGPDLPLWNGRSE